MKNFLKRYLSNDKDISVIKNIIAAFLIKGGALLISLATLPAFIRYFNNQEVLGVWFTIFSVLIWVLTFDFGIGNGLRNKLVGAIVRNDRIEIKEKISSAYFVIGLLSLFVTIIGFVFFPIINWNSVFNISEKLVSSKTLLFVVICAFITIMLQFYLRLINFILYALQRSALNNLIALITSTLQLIFVLSLPSFDIETNLKLLSVIYLFCVNFPLLVATIYIFSTKLKGCNPSIKYLNRKSSYEIISLGGIFFWNQIMFTAITQTNLILITNYIGPGKVVEYQIYYRLFMLSGMLFNLALAPIWSAVTKAIEEKDVLWINKYFKILNIMVLIVFISQFLLLPVLQGVVNVWIGPNLVDISLLNASVFAFFGGIFVFQSVLSTFACGIGEMKLQAYFYTIGVILKFIFVYIGTSIFDNWVVIVFADILIFAPYCLFEWLVLKKRFSKVPINNRATTSI